MRANTWTNADGLEVFFGTANTKNAEAGSIETKGRVRQVELKSYYDMDVTEADVKTAVIPAGAHILSANLVVTEAYAGGTSIDFGTITTDGVTADADALIAAVATASLTDNAVVVGAGALVGAVTAEDINLTYEHTGTFTAGESVLIVEYVMPAA